MGEPAFAHVLSPVFAADGLTSEAIIHNMSAAVAFLFITFLHILIGELVPKAIALQKAEPIAVVLAVPLDLLAKLAHPIVWVLQVSAKAVLRLFGITGLDRVLPIHDSVDAALAATDDVVEPDVSA